MKGEHVRFIRGHVVYLRVRQKLTPDLWHEEDRGYITPCWIFNLRPQTKAGYCRVSIKGKVVLAHRASYKQFVGPISPGKQLDHLCRQTSCIRPDHLEPVTHAENGRRGNAAKLSHATAALIRESPLRTGAIAELLGVSRETIRQVRKGETWA
jgi:hypothetical protein